MEFTQDQFYQQLVKEEGGGHVALTFTSELLAIARFWKRGTLLSSVVYPLLSSQGFNK